MKLSPFRAVSHYGMGGNKVDLTSAQDNPLDWMLAQLHDDTAPLIAGLVPSSHQLVDFAAFSESQGQLRSAARSNEKKLLKVNALASEYRARIRTQVTENFGRRFVHSVTTSQAIKERLSLFWSNHFCVSRIGRRAYHSACPAYENEAIRSHLNGSFSQMLLAAVSHPVMLIYLDNIQSMGPNTRRGTKRNRGLNENLAREILELHTLGVGGGYSQADVLALAKIITGWTIDRYSDENEGKFYFDNIMHESGKHKLLGRAYANTGYEQGVAALQDLAVHPATAKHIATKLVRHFVNDEPASADVAAVAKVFIKTQGDLPSVHEAVFKLKSGWNPENKKFRTPYELVVAVVRGLGIQQADFEQIKTVAALQNILRVMNNEPFTAPSPAGWPDTTVGWDSPGAIKQRLDWGVSMGERFGNQLSAHSMLKHMVDPADAAHLGESIARAASTSQALALLLASPNIQWR